ncbi:hypothetical protein BFS30_24920 [Pedobacter steynii]|uniref:Lipocalin-like domain-containing protein n=2 Tax=Pedobacter steynii TaxID=430522 RepID=A0A1D7QN85_9SPHI|nr:hypothetical protein BFS30_24920 [Pedobacter steynii]
MHKHNTYLMKKILIICLVTLAGLAGCKKENQDKKNNRNLLGTWQVQKQVRIEYENNVEKDRDERIYDDEVLQFIFQGENKLSIKNGTDGDNTEEYTYTLSGDTLELREGDSITTLLLRFNGNKQMILSLEDIDVDGDITYKNVTEFTLDKK